MKTFYGFGEKHFCGHFCKQKTDILKEGGSFTRAVGGKGFVIKEFLMRSFQRKSRDVSVMYAVAYHGWEDFKERLGLNSSLKWHSFCIGSATKGNILGVRRSVVKGAENW